MSYYEVWDLGSRNRLTDMETESEALAFVRDLLSTGDPTYITDLALGFTDDTGDKHAVAEGIELAARALANTTITVAA